jgi:DNA-binding NarL/FixJ family response regulator
MATKVFIVDDHPLMRRGYASLIGREPDLTVCGEAGSANEAIAKFPTSKPDFLICDISLGGMSGLELVKHLLPLYPDLLVLIISMHDEATYADRALAAGARGYMMKSEVDTKVIEAIRRILAGGFWVSEQMTNKIFSLLGSNRQKQQQSLSPIDRLSDRELEIFQQLGNGKTSNEIATALMISPKTVETHRSRIKEKLGIESGHELMRRAVQWVQEEERGSRNENSV